MHTQIIDGKKLRDQILEKIKKEIASLPFQPVFCDVLVGEDPGSKQYVEMKMRYAEKVGIVFHNATFASSVDMSELIDEIRKINDIKNICGIIVQLPLPGKFDKQKILDAVSPTFDVDCLNTKTSSLFYKNEGELCFPTALACVYILDSLNINLADKKIVVIGQGVLVGKPVAHIFKARGFDTEIITNSTEEDVKKRLIKNADVIISATGSGKIIKGDMIKEGVIIIDAGTSESNGGIVGDVDLDSVLGVAGFVSPVPGGVGPVTVAMLLNNILQVAENKNNE